MSATLTVTKAGTGVGTVTSRPVGVDCGVDCSEVYAAGTDVILSATPAAGSVFLSWGGDPDCVDAVVTVRADTTCSVTFSSLEVGTASTGLGGESASGDSVNPTVSADGRLVAFDSTAANLAPNCLTAIRQVYVRDRLLGTVICVSVTGAGTPGNGASQTAVISADGMVVAFQSVATNLTASCTTGTPQIFVRELTTGTTTCVSVSANGVAGNADSETPVLSGDGRFVAFRSGATNLAPPCGGTAQILLRDRSTGTTTCASVGPAGAPGDLPSALPAISAGGGVIAWESSATNLAPGCDVGAATQVFVRVDGNATCVSVAPDGVTPGNAASRAPALSADGLRVAFHSNATNLVSSGCTVAGPSQVFVRDRTAGTTMCASLTVDGAPGSEASTDAALTANGQTVAFSSTASDLLPPSSAGSGTAAHGTRQALPVAQILKKGLASASAVTRLLSQAGGAAGNGISRKPAVSADGTVLAFQSTATNLSVVATSGQNNVFIVVEGDATTLPGPVPPGTTRPVLTSPASGRQFALTGSTAIPFAWNGVAGVTQYFFEFTGPNRQFANLNGTAPDPVNGGGPGGAGGGFALPGTSLTATLDPSFPPGVYQVRVIGLSPTGQFVGSFSDAVTVILGQAPVPFAGQPTITSPAAGTTLARGASVTVRWTAVAGATQYGVEVTGVNRTFANPNASAPDPVNGFGGAGGGFTVVVTAFTTTVPTALTPGVYQVRVIGLGPNGELVGTFGNAVALVVQ